MTGRLNEDVETFLVERKAFICSSGLKILRCSITVIYKLLAQANSTDVYPTTFHGLG
jgi:hypothetical protein